MNNTHAFIWQVYFGENTKPNGLFMLGSIAETSCRTEAQYAMKSKMVREHKYIILFRRFFIIFTSDCHFLKSEWQREFELNNKFIQCLYWEKRQEIDNL